MARPPTELQRRGDFSQTFNANGSLRVIYNPFTTRQVSGAYVRDPFPNNVIPSQFADRVAKGLLQYWPLPNRPAAPLTAQDNFVSTAGQPANATLYSIRIDHTLTDNQRFFGRWSYKYPSKTERTPRFPTEHPGGPGAPRPTDKRDAAF